MWGRRRRREEGREERGREMGVGEKLREREGVLILEVLLKYLLVYLAALDLVGSLLLHVRSFIVVYRLSSCGMWA